MVQAAAAVGIACAFPIFGALIDAVNWPSAFWISGTITAVLALAWTVYGASRPSEHPRLRRRELAWPEANEAESMPPPAAASAEEVQTGIVAVKRPPLALARPTPPTARLWRQPSLMLLTISYAAVGYVEYLFFFWMHYYFEDVLNLGKDASRNYAAILMLSMALGMIFGGWAADRLRAIDVTSRSFALVPVAGLCAGAVLLLLGVVAQQTFLIVTLLSLALAAVGATEAPIWTMATELGGRYGGTAAAICNTGGNAGGLIAPIITPLVSGWLGRQLSDEQVGWQLGIALGSLIAIFGAVLWYWIRPPQHAEESLPSLG
jgi:MFS family permease